MRRLIASEYITLDGVIDNPAWTMPYWSDEIAAFQEEQTTNADTLLLGRVTYDGMSQAWPKSQDQGAEYFNTVRKEIVTSTLSDLDWNNSHALRPEQLAEKIKELKAQDGQDILIYGSGQLVRSLLQAGLIDELRLLVYPVIVGEGKKLFAEPLTLQPLSSRTFDTGVTLLTYGPKKA